MQSIDQKIKDLCIEILVGSSFCSDLSHSEIVLLRDAMELRRFNAGDEIIKEGEFGSFLGFVVDGEVLVTKAKRDGGVLNLRTLSVGKTFGEMSVVDRGKRSASVHAKGPVMIITTDYYAFEKLVDENHHLGVKLLRSISKTISERLREASEDLAAI